MEEWNWTKFIFTWLGGFLIGFSIKDLYQLYKNRNAKKEPNFIARR